QIHAASLEILERLGVRVHLPEAAALLRKGGAQVSDEGHVRLPARLVEWALRAVPSEVTLYNRLGEAAMPLSGERCFFGPGSDTLNLIDHRTSQRRKPRLSDVGEGARLCDALKHIDFVMSMCLPADVEATIADTYQTEALLINTVKPILLVSYGVEGLVDAVEMAEAVLGGAEALRQRPLLSCYINVVSGAVHNAEGLQKLLFLADKGLPIIYIPGSNAGVTSPATLPGAIALDNAGGLLGLTLAQLRREGAPYIVSAMDPAALDMRTMVSPYAYAERGVIRSVAQRYGLPAFALAGVTDAKLVDQQAAAEAALTLMAEVLMGGNLIHDLGYLESGLTFSFAQLAICDQIVDWIKAFYRPVEVNAASLALDVIEQVGPGGQYLKHRHTRQNYRQHWVPDLFERSVFGDWEAKGALTLGERAAARVEQILQSHTTPPLPAETQVRLREIVRRAERRAGVSVSAG
ncbi:MAG: trimethylamine methyltransferase family protein, partial [Chloroflexi bacterium]|nr:trimethylamine methyltransferase family protein [Chloroflexota bacterium]